MLRVVKLITIHSNFEIKEILQSRIQCPLLTMNKICYGYLNNDWIQVFSNAIILVLSISFLCAYFGKGSAN